MIKLNEENEIIDLIRNGFDLELISFELEIPIEKLQEYKKRLEKPKLANRSIKGRRSEKETQIEIQEEAENPDYEKTINRYKNEIVANPQKAQDKRNILSFSYYKAGLLDEARNVLMKLIEETHSHIAYRQLILIEKENGNFEEAKLWAYEALDRFPKSIQIREQLISIAKIEDDRKEVIRQLKDIININTLNEKNKKRLKTIMDKEER